MNVKPSFKSQALIFLGYWVVWTLLSLFVLPVIAIAAQRMWQIVIDLLQDMNIRRIVAVTLISIIPAGISTKITQSLIQRNKNIKFITIWVQDNQELVKTLEAKAREYIEENNYKSFTSDVIRKEFDIAGISPIPFTAKAFKQWWKHNKGLEKTLLKQNDKITTSDDWYTEEELEARQEQMVRANLKKERERAGDCAKCKNKLCHL